MARRNAPNPTDLAKPSVTRRVLTNGDGVPLGVAVEEADHHNLKTAWTMGECVLIPRPEVTIVALQGLHLIKAHASAELRDFEYTLYTHLPGEEARAIHRAPGYKTRRRVLEWSYT